MYDTVTCLALLPDGSTNSRGQTRAFECYLLEYIVSPEGKLLAPVGEYVSTPKEDRPYPDADEGTWESAIGSIKWVGTHEPHPDFTGELDVGDFDAVFFRGQLMGFYSENREWFEFSTPTPK